MDTAPKAGHGVAVLHFHGRKPLPDSFDVIPAYG